MSAVQVITFVMPDGSTDERRLEGISDRTDRSGLSVHELAALLAADRGAVEYTVAPWLMAGRAS